MHEHDLTWEALEYDHVDKTPDWYWGLGLIALVGVGLSIYFQNLLFAAVILLSAFALALYGGRAPRMEKFAVTNRGLIIGHALYPYQTLDSFWVHDDAKMRPTLIVKSKKVLMPLIIIPITHVRPSDIRERLLDEIHEEEHHLPLSDALMKFFHF